MNNIGYQLYKTYNFKYTVKIDDTNYYVLSNLQWDEFSKALTAILSKKEMQNTSFAVSDVVENQYIQLDNMFTLEMIFKLYI